MGFLGSLSFDSCFSRLVAGNSGGVLFFSRDTCGPFPASSFWKCWACLQWIKLWGIAARKQDPLATHTILHWFRSPLPSVAVCLRPPYYFMAAHLLSPVSQQPRATALSDAANRADCGPLSGLCSLLHGPGFSVVSGYQILNPSIIWHLLGKRRGKSFPSLGAEDGFSHTPQVW